MRSAQPGNILSLLQDGSKPILLLGAGASKQSGIKLVAELVEEIAKWGYCQANGISILDPRLTQSDWRKWLEKFTWYSDDFNSLYPTIVDQILTPRQARKDFFLKAMHPGVPASKGYEAIAELMHLHMLDTVFTSNFDDCLNLARNQINKPAIIQHIKSPSDHSIISYSPRYPQNIYLHGSVEHYSDQNLATEILTLNSDLASGIKPLIKDRPIIVVGYRGAEPSIMNGVFLENLTYTNNFTHGIYWCVLRKELDNDNLKINNPPPLLKDLIEKANGNFHIVPIDGFDELFHKEILSKLKATEIDLKNYSTGRDSASVSLTFETTISGENTIGPLEIPLMRDRIISYCNRLNIKVHELDNDWLYNQLSMLKVVDKANEVFELTNAGVLLFSSQTQKYFQEAYVLLRFNGKASWLKKIGVTGSADSSLVEGENLFEKIIDGNLWTQLNETITTFTLINKPFRLKGEKSENVYPYPNLALKEIIVNSLVHRDYQLVEPVLIEIYENRISITSPGGLVEEMKRQILGSKLEEEIRKGKRGIKAYRNPIIADLFYGSGAMDKEGSGLSDVMYEVNKNQGAVSFGTTQDGKYFNVTMYSRTDDVDEVTSTAKPFNVNEITRFTCNLFEIIGMPQELFHADTSLRYKGDFKSDSEFPWLPPALFYQNRIWSFYDLSNKNNPYSSHIDLGTFESISIQEFTDICGGTNELVRLLNESLIDHLFSVGLRVDVRKKRAYFTKNMDGTSKEISYHGRFKKATRTVAKPRVNPTTEKISYWEHKSIWFSIQKYQDSWYLCINPSYVFTTDGVKLLLKSERVNKLSTKRASRDYNQQVHNDITFWANYISRNSSELFKLSPNLRGENKEKYMELITPDIIVASVSPNAYINEITLDDGYTEEVDFDLEQIENEIEEIANEELKNSETDEHED